MKMNSLLRALFGCALSLSVSIAVGQTITGSINGEVTDPSGAVVPGAHVVAANLDTGVSTAAITNDDGLYQHQLSAHRPLPGVGRRERVFARNPAAAFTLEVQQTAKLRREAGGGQRHNQRERLCCGADPEYR
jgi:hypothetical protein